MEMKLPLTEEVEESVRKLWKLETNPLIFKSFQCGFSLGQLNRLLWKEKDVILKFNITNTGKPFVKT